jgi:molybdopterin converting factor small subunit
MAKIDVSTIEGYEEMTAEEKLAALEGLELPEPDYTGYVKKELFDKASSEIAGYKKQIFEKMTAEEAAKAEADEKMAAIQQELEQLRQDKVVQEYTAQFLSIGYDKELASETAVALQRGDMNTVFLNQTKFATLREKALKAELMKNTPKPPAGNGAMIADYQKKIDEAQANGDFTAVAYYTRLAAQLSQQAN